MVEFVRKKRDELYNSYRLVTDGIYTYFATASNILIKNILFKKNYRPK